MTCRALLIAEKYEEAQDLLTDTFHKCVRELGPKARVTRWAMRNWWDLVHGNYGRIEMAQVFKQICIAYGCDVSELDRPADHSALCGSRSAPMAAHVAHTC